MDNAFKKVLNQRQNFIKEKMELLKNLIDFQKNLKRK